MNIDGYKVETHPISVWEYQQLRNITNWSPLKDEQIEIALGRDLYSVVVVLKNEIIGMGRVIGDGAIYFYIQDVIVHPDQRYQGIGKLIMQHIETYLLSATGEYAFIKGVESFYTSLGYSKRAEDSPGMFKIISNKGF